eukprot:4784840-Lingulodinium_polyedra.AAC.1
MALSAFMLPAKAVPVEAWLEGNLRLDPRIGASRTWQLARPVGKLERDGSLDLVYSPSGPCTTLSARLGKERPGV